MDYKEALIAYCDELKERKENHITRHCNDWIFGAIDFALSARIIDAIESDELFKKYELC